MTRSGSPRVRRARQLASSGLVLAGLAAVIALTLLSERRDAASIRAEPGPRLTQPLRVEVLAPGSYEQLLLGLRVHHYRVKPRGEARFRDVFYDTPRWDLHRHGYSYRFRTRLDGVPGPAYSLRLEQEPRFVASGAAKIDLASDLPDARGAAIAAGAWGEALEGEGLAPVARLHAVLEGLGVPPAELGPRLVAEQERERLEVTDKGRSWFELDHESWTFRSFESAPAAPGVRFEDAVLDVRVGEADPELFRRVSTLRDLVRMIHGIRPLDRSPHERAIEALARPPP